QGVQLQTPHMYVAPPLVTVDSGGEVDDSGCVVVVKSNLNGLVDKERESCSGNRK
ncbi:hypothetical protein A2U01_0059543, partial [Trifolium medium]|nr:hypothetical protein [Trifolium medium]